MGHEFLVGAAFDDAAVFHHVNAIGHADGVEAVTDEDGGAALGEFVELLEDLVEVVLEVTEHLLIVKHLVEEEVRNLLYHLELDVIQLQ